MRTVILGGTGAIGGAAARTLAGRGWTVDVTGRDGHAMPAALDEAGVRFHAVARSEAADIGRLIGDDTDLLVDLLAFSARDVRSLLPAMGSVGHTVVISTRAVYVDREGRHINGDEAPRFPVPIREDNPTLAAAADDTDPYSREGYAPSKVAVERAALDCGLPVSVIRPSKVHGPWARNARTRGLVRRMLAGEQQIELADGGRSIDHLTAAANTAALIETIALKPARRVLNSADPDTPTAEQIVRAIAERVGWSGRLELLGPGDPERGHHPWRSAHPIVLDTTASTDLGYIPAGRAVELLMDEVDWVRLGDAG